MGQVFSPAAVESGRIPNEASFEQAITTYNGTVGQAIARGALITSVGFGPLATEGPISIRSGIDALLIHDGSPLGELACREIAIETTRASHGLVPVTVLPYSHALLANGNHTIDRYSGRQLTDGPRVVTGEDPASYISYPSEHPLTILHRYLDEKRKRLEEAHAKNDTAERLRGIQYIFETPISVGRKVLQIVDELQGTEHYPGSMADSTSIAGESLALYSGLAADTFPLFLLFADRHYTQILKHTLQGRVSESDYRELLNELDELTVPTIGWLDTLSERLPRYIDSTLTA